MRRTIKLSLILLFFCIHTAYSYIQSHLADYKFDNALQTLSRTVQYTDFPTQVSLLYDPVVMYKISGLTLISEYSITTLMNLYYFSS